MDGERRELRRRRGRDRTGRSDRPGRNRGNGGNFAFDPAAVRVSTGTTVVWEWTGEGGIHNVRADDGGFESELIDEADHTFDHAFDSKGAYKYLCVPHEAMGMKGVIVIE